MADPCVLLIHGVNTRGEWHDTMVKESRGLFDCVPIKYRYYHGLTGPVKVYVWPAAVFLFAAVSVLKWCDRPTPAKWWLYGVLIANVLLVAETDVAWSARTRKGLNEYFRSFKENWRCVLAPLAFFVVATTSIFLETDPSASIVAAIIAISIYLDGREYGDPTVSALRAFEIAAVVGAISNWLVDLLLKSGTAQTYTWTLVAIGLAAIIEPWYRRRCAFRAVKTRIGQVRETHPRPHVIAHSLGTYISGHLLNEHDRLSLGRVIFTGSVLDQKFPWHRIVGAETRDGCCLVKNYIGGVDIVPALTGLLRSAWVFLTCLMRLPGIVRVTQWLGKLLRWRPLGWVGILGFRDREPVVHTQLYDTICEKCAQIGTSVPIHNVRSRFGGHSTMNEDSEYHFYQWLPFLWGQSPKEFDYWKELCRAGNAAKLIIDRHPPGAMKPEVALARQNLSAAEQALLDGIWFWPSNPEFPRRARECKGRRLFDYIRAIREAMLSPTNLTDDDFARRVPATSGGRRSRIWFRRARRGGNFVPRWRVRRC
jgi:hypothetical protein